MDPMTTANLRTIMNLLMSNDWSLEVSDNHGFSGRRWSLVVVGASVTGTFN
jgi:hypothetical protein